MPAISYRNLLNILIIAVLVMLASLSASAQDNNLKQQSKFYRDQGYQAQSTGDLDTAMSYYQKAIELDPVNAAAYNDLGVIYDIKGFKDRARESYMKCLKIDPNYQSVYFNLANFYEEKGNLQEAANYWRKRIQLGDPNDPWTKKAKERLQNIGIIAEDIGSELKREETAELIKSVTYEKDYLEDKTPIEQMAKKQEKAKKLLRDAKANYAKGEFAAALKEAATAQYFDPSNSDIDKFIEKVREKILGVFIE